MVPVQSFRIRMPLSCTLYHFWSGRTRVHRWPAMITTKLSAKGARSPRGLISSHEYNAFCELNLTLTTLRWRLSSLLWSVSLMFLTISTSVGRSPGFGPFSISPMRREGWCADSGLVVPSLLSCVGLAWGCHVLRRRSSRV